MSAPTRIRWVLALTATMLVAVTPVAHAYVDPGSTSLIFSWIVAGLAAAGMTLRIFWSRVRSFFKRSDDSGSADEERQPTKVATDTD
ncbi:MAG: hypothetical protein R3343_00125 [Nitriliruptorales bacterium]|nr:hypothetical protein [Nitriliruptorales bacterium]